MRTPDLPTGTVTFLFTDIEGSTRLLEQFPSDYAEILHRHRQLIRVAVAEENGVEVDTTGDALFCAFSSAVGAARAAAAAQQALDDWGWPGDTSVRVRMGLHTGEGRRGVEGYVGRDVHLAARVGAAAHGGQVLLSEATRVLVEADLSAGFAMLDLGHHRLKDFDVPERLTQLVIPGLPKEFPPPRGVLTRQGLPVRLSRFVGREAEIEELDTRLGSTRLLTLTGPGGTGKTRLALVVAGGAEDRYLDGAVFVDLAPIIDPEIVPSVVASRLEVPPLPGRSPVEAVIKHLAERQLLLVLDNYEQVLPAAPFVADLLAACPRLSVIVTSRAPLRLEGEQEWPVAPLSLPDRDSQETVDALNAFEAIQLFAERARTVQPSFELTEDNARSVVDICCRLDGIPLAIELAAARIRLMPPSSLSERLATSINLDTGRRDLPERHRTLRSTISWSVDLLDEADRRLFRRLAVFRGGWTLDAAQRAIGDWEGTDVVEGLGRLLQQSLIERDAIRDARGTMLETIRAFAEGLLESDELPELARRHADLFLSLAEEAAPHLLGSNRDAWLERLHMDYDNCRAAIRWATEVGDTETALRLSTALMTFWHLRNHLTEGRIILDGLLGSDLGKVERAVVAGAFAAAGELAVYQSDFVAGIARTSRSLAMYREIGDARGIALQLNNLGWGTSMQDGDAALSLFAEALKISRSIGVPEIMGNALTGSAAIHIRVGRLHEGRRCAAAAVDAFESVGERYLHVFALLGIGRVDQLEGHPEDALAHYADSLQMATEAGAGDVICTSLDYIADLLLDQGYPAVAIRLGASSQRRLQEIGGFASTSMVGMEPPLVRAARMVDPQTFARASSDDEALTIDDAVSEALTLARRIAAGDEVLRAPSGA